MSALREALEALVAGPYRLINDCGMTVAWVDPEDLRAVLAAHDDPPAPVGVERVEWGVQGERQVMRMPGEGNARWYAETTGLPVVRRTVTSYLDMVGKWEEVGDERPRRA